MPGGVIIQVSIEAKEERLRKPLLPSWRGGRNLPGIGATIHPTGHKTILSFLSIYFKYQRLNT